MAERVLIDLVCSSRCPVINFTDVLFKMAVYTGIPEVATGLNWRHG